MDVSDLVTSARAHGLGDLLRRTALRVPRKTAIVDGAVRLTYAELDAAVNRTAHALVDRGLVKGDRLALLSHNCWQYVVISLATARLGVVLVPVNFMLNAHEIAYLLGHSGATALITEEALAEVAVASAQRSGTTLRVRGRIPPAGEGAAPFGTTTADAAGGLTPARDDVEAVDEWEDVTDWAMAGDDSDPGVLVADDDPLRLMYTSGTESRPKGVLLTSRSLIAQYVSCIVDGGMTADDVELHTLPLYHCAQLDCFLGPDIYLGATSIILPGPDPATVLRTMASEGVTKYFCPPTVWIGLLRCPDFDSTDLSALRKGYYGASAMPVEVLREMQRRLPAVRLWNFYGQTEMAPLATILGPDEQESHAGSAGRAALNVETRVVDDDDHPVAPGVVGEIVHRSPHATLGYYDDVDKTAEAFRGGWFHSGDLGLLDDEGRLSVVDRKKDMIKTGGENVASREVEEAIYRLDTVAEVAVFGVSHPVWVEAVVAAVVPKAGAAVTSDEVIAHCRSVLAGFKTPKYVVLVDALPKNPSGKLLKKNLRVTHAALAAHS